MPNMKIDYLCYADDLILLAPSTKGRQKLIKMRLMFEVQFNGYS